MQITKQNDPRIVTNDPYLSMYLKTATDTNRTQFIGLPEVFEDIRAVIPNMTPERGRSNNPKLYPLPDKWQFCQILNKVDHKDPEEFQSRIADILFWTLPFAGNPVSCIPLRRTEDYLIQTKEETGQYTLDLFADDAVSDVLSWHKFWEKPDLEDRDVAIAKGAFDILKEMHDKGYTCISEDFVNLNYQDVYDISGFTGKVINTLITSGLLDNTNRKTGDYEKCKLSLSCLGESFMNVIDSLSGKTNYIYFKNYDMSFRFALCERIAKQVVADGYDFYMSIEKTERAEKRPYSKSVKKDKEPLNIWESYKSSVEVKEMPIIDDQPLEFDDEETYSEDDSDFFNPPEKVKIVEISPEVKNIKVYPKALNEQEVKEEMHRPISSSETEENKSYTSNLAPRPPLVLPQDPLVLARDTGKVDEDRVLTLSQSITEFMVKEKSNLPPNVKTALKEALMALMEL